MIQTPISILLLAALVMPGQGSQSAPVQVRPGGPGSNQGGIVPFVDQDGDGLDDGYEALIGTSALKPDSDMDSFSDLEELLLGRNPLYDEGPLTEPPLPALHTAVYVMSGQAVIQLSALHQGAVRWDRFVWGTKSQGVRDVPDSLVRRFVTGVQERPGQAGWSVQTLTLQVPRAAFDAWASSSFAVVAVVDGQVLGDGVNLVRIDGQLAQVRSMSVEAARAMGKQQGGPITGPGGVFPVEPDPPDPNPDNLNDSLCVQSLRLVSASPGGVVVYEVVSAECVGLQGAVCFASCAASVGQIIITVDVIGLIGQH